MRRAGALAVVVLALLAGLRPAAAKPPLNYQDPPPDHLTGPGPFTRLPAIDESRWVVVAVRNQPYWQAGTADPVLTNACRLGEFASLSLNRLVARFTAPEGRGLLRVVPPNLRYMLVDPRKLARPGEIYYFRDNGLPTCQVWFGGKGLARRLDTRRGTSLPPPDAQAVSKKKALVAGWPKK